LQKLGKFLDMAAAGTAGRIPGNSGQGRVQGAGQKREDDEGIQFYTLLVAEMCRGGRNQQEDDEGIQFYTLLVAAMRHGDQNQ
jgi:hypothetical protein